MKFAVREKYNNEVMKTKNQSVTVWAKNQNERTKANNLGENAEFEVEKMNGGSAKSIIDYKNYFRGGNLNDSGTN